MQTPKERFISLLVSTGREGVTELLEWLEHTDWYTAPASSRYHGSYPGGLVDHSLAVFDECVRLYNAYQDKSEVANLSRQSIILVSLLHDLCKVNTYTPSEKSRKTSTGWEKYQGYDFDEQLKFGGHGSKSVFLIMQFIKLSPWEAAAVNCHMGTWDTTNYTQISDTFKDNPLAYLLHAADESATFIMKK